MFEATPGYVGVVADLVPTFVGLITLGRPDDVFLSLGTVLLSAERRSAGVDDLWPGAFVMVDGARETRFAIPVTIGLLFSAPSAAGVFLESSTELVESLDLWNELEAVEVITPGTGLRAEEVAIGRAGGLLRPLPVVERALDVGAEASARLMVVVGRFGGIPFLLGEETIALWPSLELVSRVIIFGLSPPERVWGSLSSAGGVPKGVSVSAEAMVPSLPFCVFDTAVQ